MHINWTYKPKEEKSKMEKYLLWAYGLIGLLGHKHFSTGCYTNMSKSKSKSEAKKSQSHFAYGASQTHP